MKGIINKFALFMMVVLLSSCSYADRSEEGIVDAIYWHENQRYIAMTDNNGMIVKHRIPHWDHPTRDSIKLYVDVADVAKSWYKCEWSWSFWNGIDDGSCEIHIHNLNELGIADWNHGKFGSGSTTRID